MGVKFLTRMYEKYTLIIIGLDGVAEPTILKVLKPPAVDFKKGVVLSRRAPIWLYCFLVHYYHPTRFIAIFDPRIGGAVVVESHIVEFREGDIIEIGLDA